MAIVGDNQTKMSTCFTLDKPIGKAVDFRIRFNLEFLKGCVFDCAGCYVNRKNDYTDKDLEIVKHAQSQFIDNGYVFDEIILGPTDFFSALNTEDLLQNPKFAELFQEKTVLTILSTLQSSPEVIKKRIDLINTYLRHDIEIEILIPFNFQKLLDNDQEYISSLRQRINLLSDLKCDVEYAFQLNIQSLDNPGAFELKKISDKVWDEFKTITEFNPSFMRLAKTQKVISIIKNWNSMLSQNIKKEYISGSDKITFTMANKNHAGFNEVTYNYSNGVFYSCPFIYENVFDKSEHFQIKASRDDGHYSIDDFQLHRDIINQNQLEYLNSTDECGNCPHAISCVSKQVIDYMMDKNIKSCILAKDILDLYAA